MHKSVSPGALRVTNRIYLLSARSLLYVLLIALGCEMQPGGSAITRARADESSDALYPGRYVANCKPAAPIVGCVCETDTAGQTRQLFQTDSELAYHARIGDIEYLRMTEWLRATCIAVTRPGGLR